jgi:hypothetical protein
LNFTLLQDFQDDLITGETRKGLFEVVIGSDFAFGDIEEDILDLEDVVEVGFVAGAERCDGVLVTCDLESLLA